MGAALASRWTAAGNIVWIPGLPLPRHAQNGAMIDEADRRDVGSDFAWRNDARLLLTGARLE
jgi:hypothetical protein